MPPRPSRQELIKLEDEMIAAYCDRDFQRRLHAAWDAAEGDQRRQVKARQDVCLPAQVGVITKYGFEGTLKGVAQSVACFAKCSLEPEFKLRGMALTWLVNPPVQREPRRVDIVVGHDQYTMSEVLEEFTVGFWKKRLEQGILGSKVLYAGSLVCEWEYTKQVLEDSDYLPHSPDRVVVTKPGSVVKLLEITLRSRLGNPTWSPRIGDFILRHPIGSGAAGVCVYSADHIYHGGKCAVKWPAKPEEARALIDLHRRAREACRGIPSVVQYGRFEDRQYIVLELLGENIVRDFRVIQAVPLFRRWSWLCTMGRVLLKRLETVHSCGFVHCDLSPENVLHGSCRDSRSTLFLVDFGLAQRYPGGKPLAGDQGSAEWSSARSADGGERRPEDDLEALGWVLAHGLVGEAPWSRWLRSAYPQWDSAEKRRGTLRQVQQAKLRLLEDGWEAMDAEFEIFAEVPEELWSFLRACRTLTKAPQLPNYARLHELLGGTPGSDPEADFESQVLPRLRQARGLDP